MTLGAGLTAFGVSNELYVANDETVIFAGFLIFATLVGRATATPYRDWADATIAKISGILNEARSGHTKAIQTRIDSVNDKKDVVDATKGLFDLAKEAVQLEHEAFQLKQKTQLAAEVKQVLDSWVRYEAQEREAEQNLLTETVIKKVAETLREDKTQKQILDGAVSEIERTYSCARYGCTNIHRAREEQEDLKAERGATYVAADLSNALLFSLGKCHEVC